MASNLHLAHEFYYSRIWGSTVNKLYEVSTLGDVWSKRRKKALKHNIVNGHHQVEIMGVKYLVAKLVLEAFSNQRGSGIVYLDGNKSNLNIENLKWRHHEV